MPAIGLAPCHLQSQFSEGFHCIQKSWAGNFSEAAGVSQGSRIWEKEALLCLFLVRKSAYFPSSYLFLTKTVI